MIVLLSCGGGGALGRRKFHRAGLSGGFSGARMSPPRTNANLIAASRQRFRPLIEKAGKCDPTSPTLPPIAAYAQPNGTQIDASQLPPESRGHRGLLAHHVFGGGHQAHPLILCAEGREPLGLTALDKCVGTDKPVATDKSTPTGKAEQPRTERKTEQRKEERKTEERKTEERRTPKKETGRTALRSGEDKTMSVPRIWSRSGSEAPPS
jgi:hypothetical protein